MGILVYIILAAFYYPMKKCSNRTEIELIVVQSEFMLLLVVLTMKVDHFINKTSRDHLINTIVETIIKNLYKNKSNKSPVKPFYIHLYSIQSAF